MDLAAAVTAEQQQALAQRLRHQDAELEERLRHAPPDWLKLLTPMHKATKQTADILAVGKLPAPAVPTDPFGHPPSGSR